MILEGGHQRALRERRRRGHLGRVHGGAGAGEGALRVAAGDQRDGEPARRVVELADVAGPARGHQSDHDVERHQARRVGAQAVDQRGLTGPTQLALEEVYEQPRDVVATLAQRGDPQLVGGEAVIERRTKAAVESHLLEVGVRRGDHPDIDPPGGPAPERLDLAGLEHAQERGLDLDGRLADLVEEEGAAVRLPEVSVARAERAGEGAARVAKQLRGGHLGRQRGHVDRDEGLGGARRGGVQRPRDQLLAGPRLAAQEHGDLQARDRGDLRAHAMDRRALADQAVLRHGVVRRGRALEEEYDALGDEDEHAAGQRPVVDERQRGAGDVQHAGLRAATLEPQRAAGSPQDHRRTADVRVIERADESTVGRPELWHGARDEDRLALVAGGELDALADPLQRGVHDDRQQQAWGRHRGPVCAAFQLQRRRVEGPRGAHQPSTTHSSISLRAPRCEGKGCARDCAGLRHNSAAGAS